MSNKLGRNSPCHCGSGKKYKKCCLIGDENVNVLKQNPDLLYEDIEDIEEEQEFVDGYDDDENYEDEQESDFIPPVVEQTKKPEAEPLPEIAAEEQQLVDDWWEKNLKTRDPDERLNHLNAFLQEYPDLVAHLCLEEEALFELGALLLRHERGGEYIDVLMNIRENFPDVYLKRFAYYDRDLVAYHVCQGEEEKADQFMDNFVAYPDDNPDVLFGLIYFLCATNQQAILSKFLEKSYLKIIYSNNILGGSEVIEPFIWSSHFIPELENGYDEKSMVTLANTFKTLNIEFRNGYYQPEFLLEKLNNITRDKLAAGEKSLEETYKSSKDIMAFYDQVSMNFMGWVHKEKNIPWLIAYFYNTIILKYFYRSIPDNKRPIKPFLFIQSQFEETLLQMSRQMFSLDATLSLSGFRAFYLFADYLLAHQAISEKESKQLQGWCKRLNEAILSDLSKAEFEAQYFVDDFLSKM